MRRYWGLGVIAMVACSQHNPASCCVTDEQCITLGLGQHYECATDQVCSSIGNCIAPECQVATDCPGTARFCVNHLCTDACMTKDDCSSDPEHPYCAPDGACGQCLDSSVCSGTTKICDTSTHACRGCSSGGDCDSKICEVDTGVCTDTTLVAYVSDTGSDAGGCTVNAPCRTIDYASTHLMGRARIHILGTTYSLPSTVNLAAGTWTLTSEHATVTGSSPMFRVATSMVPLVTIRSVTLGSATSAATSFDFQIGNGQITLDDVKLEQPFVLGTGVAMTATNSELDAGGTSAGTLTIKNSITQGALAVTGGQFLYDSNRFIGAPGTTGRAITATGGTVSITSSLFVTDGATGSVVLLTGSMTLTYSTFIDRQAVASPAITCVAMPLPASVPAILDAWNTVEGGCSFSHSLFPIGTPPGGNGNITGDPATFFVGAQDFHPTPSSPARGGATGGIFGGDHDLDGNPRPLPSGSPPDIGAYEVN